ncbi:MAG TPA: Holliday junction branch migration protein RuvA [Chloroflexia bacterium]|jgi:Holliday junction DNA helicase RuvA|nr:Holliday junction branch migration protein RuvA [Chloroflexia bacterium]HYP42246.1 Holliday junction branch migration protein RuvA [Chloroflexia bacterium]
MIVGLEGTVASFGVDHIVLNVGGVFYKVAVPASSISQLGKKGETVRVYTHLYVREDQLALYGAADERQLRMFETLLGVSGIGPKVGLSILSTMPVESLENAIASGNVDLLTRIPGIGRKTASRLVLELKGKLDLLVAAGISASPTAASEVVEALSGLGYSPAEIQAALSTLPKEQELTTEDMVMFALKRLGR